MLADTYVFSSPLRRPETPRAVLFPGQKGEIRNGGGSGGDGCLRPLRTLQPLRTLLGHSAGPIAALGNALAVCGLDAAVRQWRSRHLLACCARHVPYRSWGRA